MFVDFALETNTHSVEMSPKKSDFQSRSRNHSERPNSIKEQASGIRPLRPSTAPAKRIKSQGPSDAPSPEVVLDESLLATRGPSTHATETNTCAQAAPSQQDESLVILSAGISDLKAKVSKLRLDIEENRSAMQSTNSKLIPLVSRNEPKSKKIIDFYEKDLEYRRGLDVSLQAYLQEKERDLNSMIWGKITRIESISVGLNTLNISQRFTDAGLVPQLEIPPLYGFVDLPRHFLGGSGLGKKSCDIPLFARQSFLDQIDFIQKRVIEEGMCGSILGQPGTGKSVATYLYASILARNWTVIWLHMEFFEPHSSYAIRCVQMKGNVRKIALINSRELTIFLESAQNFWDEREILILDGIVHSESTRDFFLSAARWWQTDESRRRFISVRSRGDAGKYKPVDLAQQRIERFNQASWTLEEYKKAVENKVFLEKIDRFLDANPVPGESTEKRVDSKYFYSGGCARSMLESHTEEVIQLINGAIDSLSDISKILGGDTGIDAKDTSHNLRNVTGDGSRTIISAYAGFRISVVRGPDLFRNIAMGPLMAGNHFIKGGLFELFFFAHARCREIRLQNQKGEEITWKTDRDVSHFKPKKPDLISCPQERWLIPSISNQPGFDGMFLYKRESDGKRVSRFVQITIRTGHELKLSYLLDLVRNLKAENVFDAEIVEIFFIVPTSILAHYKIGKIENPKSLAKHYGWPSTEENVRNQISILGLKF